MWVKQCHKPPMCGKSLNPTYKMVMTGGWFIIVLATLGLCWPILKAMLASWGLCWPILGLCWPILGLCWPILRPMLAHVDPSWATRSEKWEKMGRAQNTVKRDCFWRPGWSAAGAAAPLSYGEERNAFGNATARGPLAGFKGCRPCRRPRNKTPGTRVFFPFSFSTPM